MKVVILGAGISGISAGYHLALRGIEADIYEKNNSWGGLCDNFEINGFRFDYAIHLSFTKNKYVRKLFSKSCEFYTHIPSQNLSWTSVALVSLGFKRPDITKYLWFYVYDEDLLPARVYSPSLKSPNNVPNGCSSLQFEIYFSKYKPLRIKNGDLIGEIVRSFSKIGLFTINDIVVSDYREIEYGNVIFDRGIYKNKKNYT